jgi:tryptophan-rich sensory protein
MKLASGALLIASLALVLAVATAGGIASATGLRGWYDGLDKAPWNPPDWVFGPAWTILYTLMAVAAWLVMRAGFDQPSVRTALVLYVGQLALNLAWSLLFFAAHSPGWALVDIVALDVLVAATLAAFWRIDRVAGWLLVPYLAWIVFATTLNAWVVMRT